VVGEILKMMVRCFRVERHAEYSRMELYYWDEITGLRPQLLCSFKGSLALKIMIIESLTFAFNDKPQTSGKETFYAIYKAIKSKWAC
jgi:hypothetical protein